MARNGHYNSEVWTTDVDEVAIVLTGLGVSSRIADSGMSIAADCPIECLQWVRDCCEKRIDSKREKLARRMAKV